MKAFAQLQDEDKFGITVTAGVHVILLIFFLIYTLSSARSLRPSFINVQFGAFKEGMQTEFAQKKEPQVATNPNPSEIQPEDPKPEKPDPVEKQVASSAEITKPVDAPDQEKDVKAEELKTPDTDKVNPTKKTSSNKKQDVIIPPKAQQAEVQQEGAKTSGTLEGSEGALDADQGKGNEKEKSAPYNLNLEGLSRDPLTQPMPTNDAGIEATIKLRFEVTPTGKLVNIIPVKKSGNPALDRQVIQILSRWHFSRLPSNVPQENQTGTITFSFVAE